MSPGTEASAVDPCRRNLVWRAIQAVLQNFFVVWFRYRVEGLEHLPAGGALLLSNHQSHLDPLLIALSFKRPVSYLARHNLFEVPIVSWILRNTYVMPIRREGTGTESIRLSVDRLNQGYYVGMFPEGTRSLDGRVGELKPGFLAIVRRVAVPVVPVGIAGANLAFPKGAVFPRPRTIRVVIGEPISAESVAALSQRGREQEFVQEVARRIQACVAAAERRRTDGSPSNEVPGELQDNSGF